MQESQPDPNVTTDEHVPDDANEVDTVLPEDHAAINPATGDPHDFYCPGCGRGYPYPALCVGTASAPHQEIQTVSTDELKSGDTDKHTAAPNTGT